MTKRAADALLFIDIGVLEPYLEMFCALLGATAVGETLVVARCLASGAVELMWVRLVEWSGRGYLVVAFL